MDFDLTAAQADLRRRAASFVDEVCIPLEPEAERGVLDVASADRVRDRALELGLVGSGHHPRHGGQGMTMMEQVILHEELGRNTNGIWTLMPGAYNVLALGSDEQIEQYLKPVLRGELEDAYAVTERDAGSDTSAIAARARPTATGYHLTAEKWFVTAGDIADVYIVMANVVDGDGLLPTLFLVDRETSGVRIVDNPPYTHNYQHGHPVVVFDCELPASAVLGGAGNVGRGKELQNMWFVEERIHIAARCVGAMRRLLDETVTWTADRVQGGQRLLDHQGVSFPIADSATDATASRLLVYHVAQLADNSADPKLVHSKAAMAKLFASEGAWRCADRCVQAFGGRGYQRTNTAERFLRELRVDRIWEGTSEIQRLIVTRGLERRGVDVMLSV
jgi:alkylation response protein AidB-like acyl-CoA dehydrogenase